MSIEPSRVLRAIAIASLIVASTHATDAQAQNLPSASISSAIVDNAIVNNAIAGQLFLDAVKKNQTQQVSAALANGSRGDELDKAFPHNSALHWAVWEGANTALAVLLKQEGIQVDVLNGMNETPLMIAALKGDLALLKQLLAAGAYPNKQGWTALHYAAINGHVQAMRLLLDAHAYIDASSPNNTTPLMMAAKSKNILAVKLLLDEGADMDVKNDAGWSVLTFAQDAKADDIAQGLILRVAALEARRNKAP